MAAVIKKRWILRSLLGPLVITVAVLAVWEQVAVKAHNRE
jgi:hypothetical protein